MWLFWKQSRTLNLDLKTCQIQEPWLQLLLDIRPAILQLSTRCPPHLTAFSFPLSLRSPAVIGPLCPAHTSPFISPAGITCPFPLILCHIVFMCPFLFGHYRVPDFCLVGNFLIGLWLFGPHLFVCVETCLFQLAVFCTLWTAATVLPTSDDRCSVYLCEPAPFLSYLIHVFGQISLVLMFCLTCFSFAAKMNDYVWSVLISPSSSGLRFCSLDMNECIMSIRCVCFSMWQQGTNISPLFAEYFPKQKNTRLCGHTVGSYLNSAQRSAAQHVRPGFFNLLLL